MIVFCRNYNGGGFRMTKDSQVDKKDVRIKKARGGTPLTRENMNQNRNAKKHSIPKSSTPGNDPDSP